MPPSFLPRTTTRERRPLKTGALSTAFFFFGCNTLNGPRLFTALQPQTPTQHNHVRVCICASVCGQGVKTTGGAFGGPVQ